MRSLRSFAVLLAILSPWLILGAPTAGLGAGQMMEEALDKFNKVLLKPDSGEALNERWTWDSIMRRKLATDLWIEKLLETDPDHHLEKFSLNERYFDPENSPEFDTVRSTGFEYRAAQTWPQQQRAMWLMLKERRSALDRLYRLKANINTRNEKKMAAFRTQVAVIEALESFGNLGETPIIN